MNKEQKMVTEFHEAFNITINKYPAIPTLQDRALRQALIAEELEELETAMLNGSITESADALADLLYVVYGTAVSFGLDIEPIFAEVHRSNMTKIGGHKRADGKWVKPDTYSPAKLQPIINSQKELTWSGRYNRVLQWAKFNRQMELHIEQYTRQQYGTEDGNEQVDNFTVDDCWRSIERYFNRRGKNARGPIEELRDLIKIGHYAQLLYDKRRAELGQPDVYAE